MFVLSPTVPAPEDVFTRTADALTYEKIVKDSELLPLGPVVPTAQYFASGIEVVKLIV